MTSLEIIIAAAILLGVLLFSLMTSADLFTAFMVWIGNPILRKLGLQSDGDPNKEFAGRYAKVISNSGSEIKVALDGTSWSARTVSPNWTPSTGESVRVDSIDGLTLQISKVDNTTEN